MKVKRDKIVLIIGGISVKYVVMTQTPVLISTLLSPKRDSLTQFQPVGPSKLP